MLKNKYLNSIFNEKYFAQNFELQNGKNGKGIFNDGQNQSSFGFADVISSDSELLIKEEEVLNLEIVENMELTFDDEVFYEIKTIKKNGDGTTSLKLERM